MEIAVSYDLCFWTLCWHRSFYTVQEVQIILPFTTVSQRWSLRKYILKHTQMVKTFDTKIVLHNYISY